MVTPMTARMFRRRHRIGRVTSRKTGRISHEVVETGWASDSSSAAAMFRYIRNAPATVMTPASR